MALPWRGSKRQGHLGPSSLQPEIVTVHVHGEQELSLPPVVTFGDLHVRVRVDLALEYGRDVTSGFHRVRRRPQPWWTLLVNSAPLDLIQRGGMLRRVKRGSWRVVSR